MCKYIVVVIVDSFVIVNVLVVVVVVTIVVIVVAAVDVFLSISFRIVRIFDHCIDIKVPYVLFLKSANIDVAYENNLSILLFNSWQCCSVKNQFNLTRT